MKLPPRTVERLSKYRRLLSKYKETDGEHIYSHNLARLLNLTPEQVRRDLMLIGHTGNHRRGYSIEALIDRIGKIIDSNETQNIAIVGIGNLGRAVTTFIRKADTQLKIVACFDADFSKTNNEIVGIQCYHTSEIPEKVKMLDISMAILTVPPDAAVGVTKILTDAGIKGILNFTSVHLDVPESVYLKDYDIITSLEEIGFFIRHV